MGRWQVTCHLWPKLFRSRYVSSMLFPLLSIRGRPKWEGSKAPRGKGSSFTLLNLHVKERDSSTRNTCLNCYVLSHYVCAITHLGVWGGVLVIRLPSRTQKLLSWSGEPLYETCVREIGLVVRYKIANKQSRRKGGDSSCPVAKIFNKTIFYVNLEG